MRKLNLIALSVLLINSGFAASNDDTTLLQTSIINQTGQSIFFTQGSQPDPKHLNPKNPMMCPVFADSAQPQTLEWHLNSSLFSPNNPSPDIETRLYLAHSPSSPSTPVSDQSVLCPTTPSDQQYFSDSDHVITCTNQASYITQAGGIKFSSYTPGQVTVSNLTPVEGGKKGYTATCTLNPYTYTNTPLPYREINVGQNYVPPGQQATLTGPSSLNSNDPLPTRTTPLLILKNYMGNYKNGLAMPLPYNFSPSNNPVINGGPQSILQNKEGRIFTQQNIPYTFFERYYNPNATAAADGCKAGGDMCTPFVNKEGHVVKNKFILWANISTTVNTSPTQTQRIEQTFPLVISNAIRAKTVRELTDQRMLWLVENNKIPDDDTRTLKGIWLDKQGKPNQNNIAPDYADPVQPDPRDYANITAHFSDFPQGQLINVVPLAQYFVRPHTSDTSVESESSVQYTLDASNLSVDDSALSAYGVSKVEGQTTAPIAHIQKIDDTQFVPGVSSTQHLQQNTSTGYTQAGNSSLLFQVGPCANGTWPKGVTPPAGQVCLQMKAKAPLTDQDKGVYQVNVRALNLPTQNSAFATFYLYLNDTTPGLTEWNQGALPNFNVLAYTPGKKFGTAYMYTTYDFTKSYSQNDWEKNIGLLFSDLEKANSEYGANVKSAFVDVNNISFANSNLFWPVDTQQAGPTHPYNLEQSIQPSGLQTNLNGDLTSSLLGFLGQQKAKGINPVLTIYPQGAVKTSFAGFNPQQRQYFVDYAMAPLLKGGFASNPVSGLSMDFEGGLNSVGDTQFYKLLADKLAYRGKWLSYFYFTTLVTPSFVSSLGPLGSLEVSTYDVGTYRAPGPAPLNQGSPQATYNQTEIPNTIPLKQQSYQPQEIQSLYQAYQNDTRCNNIKLSGDQYKLTSISWCNNSTNQSLSENTRMWTTYYKQGVSYPSPELTMKNFFGKFQLILPTSWSATQWTQLYVWHPDLKSAGQQGLFLTNTAKNQQNVPVCQATDFPKDDENLAQCLFKSIALGGVSVQHYDIEAPRSLIKISALPGRAYRPNSTGDDWAWTPVKRLDQTDYMYTNFSVYKDMADSPNLVGIGAYALTNYGNVPKAVSSVIVNDKPNVNAALQQPWYIGFNPQPPEGFDKTGKEQALGTPGYSETTSAKIWQAFGDLMQRINK